jgi:hypothetical protein
MAALDKALGANVATLAAVGAAALVLPRLFPRLASPLRSVFLSGLTLVLEAEFEAEGGLVEELVEETVKTLISNVSGPGSESERQHAAHQTIRRFQGRARARARWHGWGEQDKADRYRRQIDAFKRGTAAARKHQTKEQGDLLARAVSSVIEDV